MSHSPGGRLRGKRSREGEDSEAPPDVTALKAALDKEEEVIRIKAKEVLNCTIVSQIGAISAIEERLEPMKTYEQALESGIVGELRSELRKTFKMGNRLETWLNTYTPPLASGGNAGISGEVQEGMYGNIHGLTAGSNEALHRMLAFEKEYCTQRTKCSDEAVWFRYKNTLEANMLHDLTKTCMTIHSDLLNVASTIINNMQHLKTNDGDHMRNMY